MTSPHRRCALALLAIALLSAGCGGPAPSPPPPPSRDEPVPARAVAERDGVGVSLTIDRQRVAVGGVVEARVEVVNFQPGIVFWQGGGCDLRTAFELSGPDQGLRDPGRGDWPGDLGILKLVTSNEELSRFLPAEAHERPGAPFLCTADLRVNELESGETVTAEAIWPTNRGNGFPAVPGPYVVSVSFPYLARLAAGPFLGDPIEDRRPLDVQLPFAVEGERVVAMSQGQAIDAVLGHRPFAAWLADVPRARWTEGRIEYVDSSWVFTLRVAMPDERAIVTVDAATGAVREFRVVPGL